MNTTKALRAFWVAVVTAGGCAAPLDDLGAESVPQSAQNLAADYVASADSAASADHADSADSWPASVPSYMARLLDARGGSATMLATTNTATFLAPTVVLAAARSIPCKLGEMLIQRDSFYYVRRAAFAPAVAAYRARVCDGDSARSDQYNLAAAMRAGAISLADDFVILTVGTVSNGAVDRGPFPRLWLSLTPAVPADMAFNSFGFSGVAPHPIAGTTIGPTTGSLVAAAGDFRDGGDVGAPFLSAGFVRGIFTLRKTVTVLGYTAIDRANFVALGGNNRSVVIAALQQSVGAARISVTGDLVTIAN